MPESQAAPPPSAALQATDWLRFYEAGWNVRLAFVEERIARGETHPYRILKQLKAEERKKRITFDSQTGVSQFSPLPVPEWAEIGPAGTPMFSHTSLRGNRIIVPFYSARTPLHEFILDYIEQTGPYDGIVELGCGDGNKLFDIYYCGGPRDIPYFGGEITSAGRALANRLARLDPVFPGQFVAFDHTCPDFSFLPKVERLLVFTSHSLEQVHRIGHRFFPAVARAAPRVTCLNFEPFGFQVENTGELVRMQRDGFIHKCWNVDFAKELMDAQSKGLLNVEYMATALFLTPDPLNPTSLAIWSAPATTQR